MAKCGEYSIPKNMAGRSDAQCAGSGRHGLDSTFARAVSEFVQYELVPAGFNVNLGRRGYVSYHTAINLAKGGRPSYLKQINYFGWGLAWEVSSISKNGETLDSAVSSINYTGLLTAMLRRGITYVESKVDGVVDVRYFRPFSVTVRNSASGGLEQEGGDGGASDQSFVEEMGLNTEAGGGSGGDESSSSSSGASISSASYFFANQFNSIVDVSESYMLQGERALANDVPLWEYVKKAVNSSLRTCSSDPDGNFIAWYPDYYGKSGKTPKVIIKDVELQDLTISQSDSEFYSHVFCPGVLANGSKVDMWLTQGVVSIEGAAAAEASSGMAAEGKNIVSDEPSPLLMNILNIPEGDEWKYSPKELYRRYGARPAKTSTLPNYQSNVLIESGDDDTQQTDAPYHILPYLYALYNFMFHWANQYKANIQVTFMPELFPGMRIKVESLDIEFYVQSVSHNMSYTGGFTTTVGAICPVGSLVSGMVASGGE